MRRFFVTVDKRCAERVPRPAFHRTLLHCTIHHRCCLAVRTMSTAQARNRVKNDRPKRPIFKAPHNCAARPPFSLPKFCMRRITLSHLRISAHHQQHPGTRCGAHKELPPLLAPLLLTLLLFHTLSNPLIMRRTVHRSSSHATHATRPDPLMPQRRPRHQARPPWSPHWPCRRAVPPAHVRRVP